MSDAIILKNLNPLMASDFIQIKAKILQVVHKYS
jgi:hypothetical protein